MNGIENKIKNKENISEAEERELFSLVEALGQSEVCGEGSDSRVWTLQMTWFFQ